MHIKCPSQGSPSGVPGAASKVPCPVEMTSLRCGRLAGSTFAVTGTDPCRYIIFRCSSINISTKYPKKKGSIVAKLSPQDILLAKQVFFFLAMSLPPDLQVLCRRLASTDPADLPPLCPSLVGHIQRCESVLSLALDQKPKDGAPEHSVLVHKLRTQITTLLNNGRSLPGRFAAAILVKAVVDVGGYECLRISEPWVRGLLTILQVRFTQFSNRRK